MSDREDGGDDVGLPKATVYKLVNGPSPPFFLSLCTELGAEMLPADISASKDAKDVIVDCCVGQLAPADDC